MQFTTYSFILQLMPVCFVLYFLANRFSYRLGKIVLALGSLVFYALPNVSVLPVLGVSILINYLFARWIERTSWRRLFLAIPLLINIGLLVFYKYSNFFIENYNAWFNREQPLLQLALPLGISFFTFQQIAYIVAVYKKELDSANVLDYLVYILYFPKLLMGPIIDPVAFSKQINDTELKKINWDNVAAGVKIFSFGLLKKMVLADTFAAAVNWGFEYNYLATSMDWLLIMLFYPFEIYFDFSGYCDMAVGSSLMLNIKLPINFDSPYRALSIRDFWKRWHISLTQFLTKYIYIPLGGSKKGKTRTYINTMLVFAISGIWHGANWTFILWGVLHGLLSILDRVLEPLQKKIISPVRWAATFMTGSVLWLLFRSGSIGQWYAILQKIIFFADPVISGDLIKQFVLPEIPFLIDVVPGLGMLSGSLNGFWMLLFIAVSFFICLVPKNNYRSIDKLTTAGLLGAAVAFAWGLICLGGETDFLYMNF